MQDDWHATRKLTLNLGIRTERERVPNYHPDDPASIAHGFEETRVLVNSRAGDVRVDAVLTPAGD